MSPADIAAYIGATAWLPQIATWIYRYFVQPVVTIIPDNYAEVGFTSFGPIFNVRMAFSALESWLNARKFTDVHRESDITETRVNNTAYRSAIGVALAAAVLSLGIGIIGADGDPANRMYFGVLAVGIIGALLARFQPHGIARVVRNGARAGGGRRDRADRRVGSAVEPAGEIILLNGFFIALFAGSAWLFRRAARGQPERGGA